VTYSIELTASARRALTHDLPEAIAVACWNFISGDLAERPYRVGAPLRDEHLGRYVARRGEFRIIYEIHEGRIVVRVITIQHRRDVYRPR
jgi:mRNA interferase RelE/StbE